MESKKEKKTSQTKTSDLWLLEVGAGMEGGGELEEGGQPVQTFSYKINKYQGCQV